MSSGKTTRGIAEDLLNSRRAVIDVGSNSVRLVTYGGRARTPLSLFNEKDLCALGTLDAETGQLRREAMDATISILKRFRGLLHQIGDIPVSIFATAAIREAPNGQDFLREITQLGFSPIVLSGEEEARYAALGVLSGTPEALQPKSSSRQNLCGDMGGGSLELTRFSNELEAPFLNHVSLSLGPLRLISRFGRDVPNAVRYVKDTIAKLDWLKEKKTGTLYAVGGAWRAIAKIHIAKNEYPLPILHQYEIPGKEAIDLCALVERQSAASLEKMPGVQRKRIETLPHAAMVMRYVLQSTKAENVIISSGGVREGILFDQLSAEEQKTDPLLAMAREYAHRYSPEPAFGEVMFDLTHSLFPDETRYERRIRHAACIMCDLAATHHPDMRAQHASDIILHSPLTAVDHTSRVAISSALYFRYRSKFLPWPQHLPESLLAEAATLKNHVIRLGFALRFASDFSASSSEIVRECRFEQQGKKLIFHVPGNRRELYGYTPQKRLTALAKQMVRDVNVPEMTELDAEGVFEYF